MKGKTKPQKAEVVVRALYNWPPGKSLTKGMQGEVRSWSKRTHDYLEWFYQSALAVYKKLDWPIE